MLFYSEFNGGPRLSAGLTYEEVISFEPPVFDGDEMES